jgi:hypothetical protein
MNDQIRTNSLKAQAGEAGKKYSRAKILFSGGPQGRVFLVEKRPRAALRATAKRVFRV